MEQIFIILVVICFICALISIIKFFNFKRLEKIEKEIRELSEENLWKEWSDTEKKIRGNKLEPYKKPEKSIILRHKLIIKELDRRDLLCIESVREQDFVIALKEMTLDILVYNAFMRQWSLLDKECEHPREAAIYFALAREELIKRYQKKYAKLKDDELKESFAVLLTKYQDFYISRDEYEEYLVAKSEMNKRRFVT